MKNLLLSGTAAILVAATAPSFAQGAAPEAPAASSSQASSASIQAGQAVYNQSGSQIGTVESVSNGQAAVAVEQSLGMGSKTVMIPESKLSAKAGGGFTASLSDDEIKALPEAQASGSGQLR